MLYSTFVQAAAFASLASTAAAGSAERPWARGNTPQADYEESLMKRAKQNDTSNAVLQGSNVQTGSQFTGEGLPDSESGEAASKTDTQNFINFCSGKSLTNGLQKTAGSCNGITMGDIPAKDKMTSSIVRFPKHNQDLQANKDFTVQVQVANLNAGTFTNPDVTYYAAPQQVDNTGTVIGHTHVTVQDLGGTFNPSQPPKADRTAFFLGIDNDGNGQGLLSAKVTGGLPNGFYRVCTMASSSNHQPVLMPIAQRGAQDDCTKFTVGQGSGGNGTAKRDVEDAYTATRRANLERNKRFASREWIA